MENRPPDAPRPDNPTDDPEPVTPADLAAADEILFSHPPLHIARYLCACGEEYPCTDVRWALRINSMALRAGPAWADAGASR